MSIVENDIIAELNFCRRKLTRIYDLIGELEYDLNQCYKNKGGVEEIKQILNNYNIIIEY